MKQVRIARAMMVLSLAAATLSSLGCDAARRNASESDILAGYQPEPAFERTRVDFSRTGDNRFLVRVRDFTPTMTAQKNRSWCWAAAAARVLEHSGVRKSDGTPVSQEDLIREFVPHQSDQSAKPELVMLSLAPEGKHAYDEAKLQAAQREDNYYKRPHPGTHWEDFQPELPGVANVVNDILEGGPAIVAVDASEGREGHIYLAYEIEYSIAAVDGMMAAAPYFVHRIKALDPYTGESAELLAADALLRVNLGGGRKSAGEYIAKATDGYRQARPARNDEGGFNFNLGRILKGS